MSAPDESTLNMISRLLDALRGHERRLAAGEQLIRELQTCHNTTVDAIQALEATQHAHADASRMSDAEREQFYAELAKPARIEALEAAASAPPDHVRDATEMVPAPADGLVERVADALADSVVFFRTADEPARAAILAVAEWLDTRGQHGCSLWLREEVQRHD